jgi:SAM-dependent methyltransferase
VGQAFHWFDHERALAEVARILRPGGTLALVWNSPDERIPWVRRLGDLIGHQDQDVSSTEHVVNSPHFGFVEERTFTSWQDVNRETIIDLALSRSSVAALSEDLRAEKLAQVRDFYDEYGRGMDGMQVPYRVRCFKAVVADPPPTGRPQAHDGDLTDTPAATTADGGARDGSGEEDPGDEMLLIDFR